MARIERFTCVKLEGTLMSQDHIQRILDGTAEGVSAQEYGLAPGEKINEAISRDWEKAIRYWQVFRKSLLEIPSDDPATSLTRERWLLPLFSILGYGRLQAARGLQAGGQEYPISHHFSMSPLHLLGCHVRLDQKTAGLRGAARVSPHGLVQEYLNRSDEDLWGIVTNGETLRLLRDNAHVARMSYIEFDLLAMMETGAYGDFAVMWMLLHATRMEAREGRVENCLLEAWARQSRDSGVRALDDLRSGVEAALRALGTGFLREASNAALRAGLQEGRLTAQDYLNQLMRLVYRLIFLFVAEDRGIIPSPSPELMEGRERYLAWYSLSALRRARRRANDTRHVDRWEGLKAVMPLLQEGSDALALPALGSFLWSRDALPDLMGANLSNDALLNALRQLCFTTAPGGARVAVDWKNIGSEELGSIYESLLELIPSVSVGADEPFLLIAQAGNDRKGTGSYYTPSSLISSLLDKALDPVIRDAVQGKTARDAITALLNLKVCDPSCGSGHFLVGAAHRIARRLAALETGEEEPSPEALRSALRRVIARCVYGVDLNPMSVELCKVALWMESLEPGKPLSFLDHHIKCGNSLIGAVPALIGEGIPDEAFNAVTGDDKELCKTYKKNNRQRRTASASAQIGFLTAYNLGIPQEEWNDIADYARLVAAGEDTSLAEVRAMERDYLSLRGTEGWRHAKLVADAWCAAFTQEKVPDKRNLILDGSRFDAVRSAPGKVSGELRAEIASQADAYRFFHWHLEFPEVFFSLKSKEIHPWGTGGGFDAVLGNPPWDKVKMEEVPWFTQHDPAIATAGTAAQRKEKIAGLKHTNPRLLSLFEEDKRRFENESKFLRVSGLYPLGAVGDVNTYAVFTELNRNLTALAGRAGFIVPTGIATDKGTSALFGDLAGRDRIDSLYSFDNRLQIFPGVHSSYRFCLLTLRGASLRGKASDYAFFLEKTDDLKERERHFGMTGEELRLFNPNTGNCPTFRNARDKQIADKVYRRCPVLLREAREGMPEENPWGIEYRRMFDMSNDSDKFWTRERLQAAGYVPAANRWRKGDEWMLPLYEGKMIYLFDHRYATYAGATQTQLNSGQLPKLTDEEHSDPWNLPMPQYWVDKKEAINKLSDSILSVISFRDITNATNQRTMVTCVAPYGAFGNKAPILMPQGGNHQNLLVCAMSSFLFDFIARMSVGGTNMNFYILKQLPVLSLHTFENHSGLYDLLFMSSIELLYTSWDLYPWVLRDLKMNIPPYRWDPERRHRLEALLNAIVAWLYGMDEQDLDYILDTFPGLRSDEIQIFGSYRMKEEILQCFSIVRRLSQGQPSGLEGFLSPAPGDASRQHAFPGRAEAEQKMPWIDWTSLPNG